MSLQENIQTETASAVEKENILEVNNLEVVYNEVVIAVRGISLAVPRGGIVALLGSNGAGKTSSIRALTGLLDVHDGRIREGSLHYRGADITNEKAQKLVREGICQVPEGRMMFAYLTVEENLRMGAASKRSRRVREDIEHKYDLFPVLRDRRHVLAGWLSGGEQQMVAVARALMAQPELLLVDELSLGLAPLIVADLMEQLRSVNRDQGTSILLIEQNARLALEIADYAYVMETGNIVLDGSADEVAANPDVREFYLGTGAESDGEKKSYADVKHYKRRKRWLQ